MGRKPAIRRRSHPAGSILFGELPLRVFVLGAGVSRASGIAVAKDIFCESMKLLQTQNPSDAGLLHDLLEYLYPNFDRDAPEYPNIEDFLNQLEMARRFNNEDFVRSDFWPRKKLDHAMSVTLKAVSDYVLRQMQDKERQEYIKKFVRAYLRPGDVVITFNWDTTIENALLGHPSIRRLSHVYVGHSAGDELALLKPHGSVDWSPRISLLNKTLPRSEPQSHATHPLIVPPVSDKGFEIPFLRRTWGFIFEAVSAAEEMYFFGYSLPREDQFARFVFRRALRNNRSRTKQEEKGKLKAPLVVNPDFDVRETFSRLIGQEFRFIGRRFEDFIESRTADNLLTPRR